MIDGKTRTLGLMGYPVKHTLSPVIHNTLSELLEINAQYVPFEVKPEEIGDAVKGAYALNILGLNATVPHKNAVMEHLVSIDDAAKAIDAVNTLVRTDEGYKGYNTDMMGLTRELNVLGISLEDETVVMLGAGGASKAVAYMCLNMGAKKVYILNRTIKKAEEIADHMNQVFDCDKMIPMELAAYDKIAEDSFVAFQCTSIGLAPNVDDVVLDDINFYQKVKVGIDLIYNPAETKFMKLVKNAGKPAYNGLRMLLYQGIIAYELWNDVKVDEDIAEQVYARLYHAIHDENIVLIGFMGAGKTTIGKVLAKHFNYQMLDTDAYIEEKEGMSISKIFETKGEAYFRQLETDVLKELKETCKRTILSTGGGLPLRKENADLLKEIGTVFYLKVSPEVVYERLKGDVTRPLLRSEDPYGRIVSLLEERNPLYEAACHIVIDEGEKTISDVIKDVENRRKSE